MVTRTLTEARNPRWGSEDHRCINIECRFKELDDLGYLPFTASLHDTAPHGAEIFALARQGKFGPVAEYQAPASIMKGPLS